MTLENRVEALEINQVDMQTCQNRMAKQVDEMYQIFTSSSWMIKLIIKIFAGIGVITGAIIGIVELIKACRN